jgi:thiol-disulfide isomerase/thioredoxin
MFSLPPLLLAAALSAPSDLELLEFTATWCSPCRAMQPIVQQLQGQGYPVRPIDLDKHPELAREFKVTRVPTFVLVSGRRPLDRIEGAASAEQLVELFRRHAKPSRAAPTAKQTNPSRAAMPRVDQAEQRAIQASVRLRVEDAQGHSYGTGTIVDVHGQEALILTCGHIFRESKGRGRIMVDLFAPGAEKSVAGELLRYELEPDVALVVVHTASPLTPVPVAGPSFRADARTPVFSVGCDHGQNPTVMRGQITAVNKYLGPANLVTSGRPVDGRSGGGLFSTDGYLIGICNAADPQIDEGLYAAYPAIHQQLDAARLSFVYQRSRPAVAAAGPVASGVRPAIWHDQATNQQPGLTPMPRGTRPKLLPPGSSQPTTDAEVICIVRLRNDPQSECKVFVLDRPSQELVERLHQERQLQSNPQMTDLRVSTTDPDRPTVRMSSGRLTSKRR